MEVETNSYNMIVCYINNHPSMFSDVRKYCYSHLIEIMSYSIMKYFCFIEVELKQKEISIIITKECILDHIAIEELLGLMKKNQTSH